MKQVTVLDELKHRSLRKACEAYVEMFKEEEVVSEEDSRSGVRNVFREAMELFYGEDILKTIKSD